MKHKFFMLQMKRVCSCLEPIGSEIRTLNLRKENNFVCKPKNLYYRLVSMQNIQIN